MQCVPQGNSSLLPLTERKSQEPCVCAIRVSGGNTCLFIYLLRKGAWGRAISSLLSMAGNMAPNLPAPLPATCWKPADVLHGAPRAPSARTANAPSYTSCLYCDFSHPFVHVSEEHYNKYVFSGEAFSKSRIENCSKSHVDDTCRKQAEQKHMLLGFPATHATVPKHQRWSAAPLLWPAKSPSPCCVLRNRSATSSCSQCQRLHWKRPMEWSESLGFF